VQEPQKSPPVDIKPDKRSPRSDTGVVRGVHCRAGKEKLGASDRGIILFRQMLHEQMERVREGEEPMNTFRDAAANRSVSFPIERVKHGWTKRPSYRPGEAGFSADAELIKAALAT
jgi:hypothetical protein